MDFESNGWFLIPRSFPCNRGRGLPCIWPYAVAEAHGELVFGKCAGSDVVRDRVSAIKTGDLLIRLENAKDVVDSLDFDSKLLMRESMLTTTDESLNTVRRSRDTDQFPDESLICVPMLPSISILFTKMCD
jgi:hypothetical protein